MARHRVAWHRAVHTDKQFPEEPWPQVAFAGRSNVGKSSLLNRLFGQRLAGVSRQPGKTRSINFYRVDDAFFLVDLPGYGYARVPQAERRRFGALTGRFLEQNPRLRGVVQLVDMRHPPGDLDRRVSAYLQDLKVTHLVVLTKADKLARAAGQRQRRQITAELGIGADEVVLFSAVDGRGTAALWSWIIACTKGADRNA